MQRFNATTSDAPHAPPISLPPLTAKDEQGLTPTTTMVVMLVVLFVEVMVLIGRTSNKMMMMRSELVDFSSFLLFLVF